MKKIISLMLVLVCVILLGFSNFPKISRCTKQDVANITIGELLDLLKAEGYTNIQHEEGTCDYILLDSGDSEDEDKNDIIMSINNIYENNSENDILSLNIEYNEYTVEVKEFVEIVFGKITNDPDLVNQVVMDFLSTSRQLQSKEKNNFFFTYCDNSSRITDNNNNLKRYELYISID